MSSTPDDAAGPDDAARPGDAAGAPDAPGAGEALSPLEQGREAYEERKWDAAHRWLTAADAAGPLAPEDLWRLAMAAYLTGQDGDFVPVLERAHRAFLATGDEVGAARCAFWLGFFLAARGEMGPATGWLGRASRLLDRAGVDCVERGYLLIPTAHQQLGAGDPAAAFRTAAAAVAAGERFGDPDLVALALHLQGHARLREARVDEGLALLDEAMVAVTADEVSPPVAGLVYCSVIGACRRVYAVGRAHEWTAALKSWCDAQPGLVPYRGHCLVYRSEILQLHGSWEEALAEAERAAELGDGAADREATGAAHYQRGELHRLRGELAAAEAAYRAASELGREPQPGLALLRLAQGATGAAAGAIHRALAETRDPARRARLLPAAIEIGVAAGDLEAAGAGCDELAAIAAVFRTDVPDPDVLDTALAHARGTLALAAGDALAALVPLRRAARGWRALDAPYEVARVRALLAVACRELGDRDSADLEENAARAAFHRLGATPDLARLDGDRGQRDPHGLTARELEVLTLLATGRTNRAIAEKLFISERTVGRHVSNIFGKLGLSSRAAATAYAYEHELV
jgi:DNA-binding CsgD family transcriptional regulator